MSVHNLVAFGASLLSRRLIDSQWRPRSQISPADPFADEGDPLDGNQDVGTQQNYIHIRIQQRNGRKTLTTLQGLPKGASAAALSCPSLANSLSACRV